MNKWLNWGLNSCSNYKNSHLPIKLHLTFKRKRSLKKYIILAALGLNCGMWDLQSSPLQHEESLVEAYELLVEACEM